MRCVASGAGALSLLLLAACGTARKPIVVGSENSGNQILAGEIVAQHLEHRLHRKIERRLGLGSESILYQAILSGDVHLYPEYPAAIQANIFKERAGADSAITTERVRGEIRRIAQLELLEPLGYENTPAFVVKETDAKKANGRTLSETAESAFRWRLAVSYDFQQRTDGLPALSAYKIPMEEGPRAMDSTQLFPSLEEGRATMIAVDATEGRLPSPQFAVLADDKGVFPIYQACLLVRQDALAADPDLLRALSDLSGKFSTGAMRKLRAALEIDRRDVGQIAAAFLAEAGLK